MLNQDLSILNRPSFLEDRPPQLRKWGQKANSTMLLISPWSPLLWQILDSPLNPHRVTWGCTLFNVLSSGNHHILLPSKPDWFVEDWRESQKKMKNNNPHFDPLRIVLLLLLLSGRIPLSNRWIEIWTDNSSHSSSVRPSQLVGRK